MSALFGGILLPESVLSTTWFALLATVVAFNTIVYVGLTLSKLMPLPKQCHPSQVRLWLAFAGMEIDKESEMNSIQPHQELDPQHPSGVLSGRDPHSGRFDRSLPAAVHVPGPGNAR